MDPDQKRAYLQHYTDLIKQNPQQFNKGSFAVSIRAVPKRKPMGATTDACVRPETTLEDKPWLNLPRKVMSKEELSDIKALVHKYVEDIYYDYCKPVQQVSNARDVSGLFTVSFGSTTSGGFKFIDDSRCTSLLLPHRSAGYLFQDLKVFDANNVDIYKLAAGELYLPTITVAIKLTHQKNYGYFTAAIAPPISEEEQKNDKSGLLHHGLIGQSIRSAGLITFFETSKKYKNETKDIVCYSEFISNQIQPKIDEGLLDLDSISAFVAKMNSDPNFMANLNEDNAAEYAEKIIEKQQKENYKAFAMKCCIALAKKKKNNEFQYIKNCIVTPRGCLKRV